MLQVTPALEAARAEAAQTPLDKIDVSRPERFAQNVHWPFFDRLRAEDPVHYCATSEFGPYWSVTRWQDIMTVETNPQVFSSEPTIFLGDPPEDFQLASFITSDEPRHSQWRKPVMPGVGGERIAQIEGIIRERVGGILDGLPRNEEFNWVERVSIELTTQMLATLFDFPFEERAKLTYWSDMTTATPAVGAAVMPEEDRRQILLECGEIFGKLWMERVGQTDRHDFLSLMANHPDTQELIEDPRKLLGNVLLLIVGGNDTTRNSISGGVLTMHQHPEQLAKLKADPSLVKNAVSEIIRWQTPLAYMRRTATQDYELGGKTIREGDKVAMWYVSANRDGDKFADPYTFDVTRQDTRRHMAFGFGIHRCMGNHVAEMQLNILWEEILKRFEVIEVVGEPERNVSNFVMGFKSLPVRIPG